ncbi:MAG TPA: mevalonate kinase [Nitrosopumilaceae archaeon]|nr:mevalonate kinase [Nitrosopumilaceae archaeon]
MKSSASAPGKVILFGEHFVVYGTRAILCAINKRIRVTSHLIDERKIKIISDIGTVEVDADSSLSDCIELMKPFVYLATYALQRFKKNCGIEIKIESEIPPGIGLGSSSASCVAAAKSITGLFEKLSREDILKLAIDAERTIFKNTSGADCSVCIFGGLAEYDITNGFKKISSGVEFELIIANSKHPHLTSKVVEKVRRFKENNPELFASLCKQESELVQKALLALAKNDLPEIGSLMSKNQLLLDQIGVSTEKLDLLVKEAKKMSFGAKITGAGGGGCIIALVDKSNINQTLASLKIHDEVISARIDYGGLLDTF